MSYNKLSESCGLLKLEEKICWYDMFWSYKHLIFVHWCEIKKGSFLKELIMFSISTNDNSYFLPI